MDTPLSLLEKVTECRLRLVYKRRLAGLCLFILLELWALELALFALSVEDSLGANALLLAALVMMVLALIHVVRRFGPAGDPELLTTSAFLDRRLQSGSLIESSWEAQSSARVAPALKASLQEQSLARLNQSSNKELVPLQIPRGFQLGLALAALIALVLFAGPLKDSAFQGKNQTPPSLLSSDNDPFQIVAGSAKDSDAAQDAKLRFNPPHGPLTKNPSQGRADKDGRKVVGAKPPSKDKVSPSSTEKTKPGSSSKTQSKDEKSGAGRSASKSLGQGKEGQTAPSNAGTDGSSKASKSLAEGYKGRGQGRSKKWTEFGTEGGKIVFNEEQVERRLSGAKLQLSWSMRQTLKNYFQKLNEEK